MAKVNRVRISPAYHGGLLERKVHAVRWDSDVTLCGDPISGYDQYSPEYTKDAITCNECILAAQPKRKKGQKNV